MSDSGFGSDCVSPPETLLGQGVGLNDLNAFEPETDDLPKAQNQILQPTQGTQGASQPSRGSALPLKPVAAIYCRARPSASGSRATP